MFVYYCIILPLHLSLEPDRSEDGQRKSFNRRRTKMLEWKEDERSEAPLPPSFESFVAVEMSKTLNDNTEREQMSNKVKMVSYRDGKLLANCISH